VTWQYNIGSVTWLCNTGSVTWLYNTGSATWLYNTGSVTWLYNTRNVSVPLHFWTLYLQASFVTSRCFVIIKYTELISVKTQQYFDIRVYLPTRNTCFAFRKSNTQVHNNFKTYPEEDNTQTLFSLHRIK
jgi:hypothetical protein